MCLHHRHVLVSGAMEDDVGPLGLEDLPHAGGVAHVADPRADIGADPVVAQFAIDFEQRVLCSFEQDEPIGAEPHGLPADFRPDAATGTGHENALPGKKPLQFRRI